MKAALHVSNLEIGYKVGGKNKIVSGPLNASLNTGELVCIMGPNGVGKSTFIRTIAGLQPPLSGTIEINGSNINTASNQEKAKLLSVVLTGRIASQYMTVGELVELGRYSHTNWQNALNEADKIVVDKALEAVGLANEKNKQVAELSDGNAQKAMIARALAQDTGIIILDEPTIHLDVRNKLMILQLLTDLSRQYDKSILLASHDLNMMLKVADKIWLFNNKDLISGIPEDLMHSGVINKVLGSEEIIKILAKEKKDGTAIPIALSGNKEAVHWLGLALEKKGYSLSATADLMIKASQEGFIIEFHNKITTHTSIENTLSALEALLNE